MPDFLSRLVERTFGLMPLAQPLTGSLFAPVPVGKSDYFQDLAHEGEPVGNQESIHIESARETGIIPQYDGQTTLKKSLKKSPDNQTLPEQYVEYGPQDKDGTKPLNQIEDKNSQGEELLYHESDSQCNVEPQHKDFAGVRENRNTFVPMLKPLYSIEQPQSPGTGHLERNMHSRPGGVQNNQDIPLITNVDSSVDKTLPGHISDSILLHESLSSLKNGKPIFLNGELASGPDSYRADDLHDTISPTASRQNQKRINNPKVNATLGQMGNMLIDQHAVAPGLPSTVPTVKVTIGRIEVKAVTPAQAPQPQTPSPRQRTILSLDDYLKQYNG
jgi:hypothetical protein